MLGNEVADGANLIFLFALRVAELESDPAFLCFGLDGLRFGRSPSTLRADLGKTDGELFGRRRGAYRREQKQEEGRNRCRQDAGAPRCVDTHTLVRLI